MVDQPILHDTVLLLADAAVLRIDHIGNIGSTRQTHTAKVAQAVVLVACRSCRRSLGLQIACCVVLVGVALPGLQPVFTVSGGNEGAVFMGAVPIGVIPPRSGGCITIAFFGILQLRPLSFENSFFEYFLI